jgi:hypothetical protein
MQTLTTLGSFAVVGFVASLVIEYTKNLFTKSTVGQRTAYTLGISVLGGLGVYFFHLVPQNVITDLVGVVAAVNTFYVFVVQYLPNAPAASSA